MERTVAHLSVHVSEVETVKRSDQFNSYRPYLHCSYRNYVISSSN